MPEGSITKIRDLLTKTEKTISPMLVKEDQIELKKLLEEVRSEANYCAEINPVLPAIKDTDFVNKLTELYGKDTLSADEYENLVSFIKGLSKNERATFWRHFNAHNRKLSMWFYKKSSRCAEMKALILEALYTPTTSNECPSCRGSGIVFTGRQEGFPPMPEYIECSCRRHK